MIFKSITERFHKFFMKGHPLFSSVECYITDHARLIKNDEKSVEDILAANGSIIHSFLNEFVNLVIITEEEYCQYQKQYTCTPIPIFVTPNWVFDSFQCATILPFVRKWFGFLYSNPTIRVQVRFSRNAIFILLLSRKIPCWFYRKQLLILAGVLFSIRICSLHTTYCHKIFKRHIV